MVWRHGASADVGILGLPINQYKSYLPQCFCRKSCEPDEPPFWTDEALHTGEVQTRGRGKQAQRETAKANGRRNRTPSVLNREGSLDSSLTRGMVKDHYRTLFHEAVLCHALARCCNDEMKTPPWHGDPIPVFCGPSPHKAFTN
jgi:hypothetical protein